MPFLSGSSLSSDGASESDATYRHCPHNPAHLFLSGATYVVTASTHGKALLFDTSEKRGRLLHTLFEEAVRWGWELQAWAVMANHYHFVAQAPGDAQTLSRMVTALHSKTAIWLNKADGAPGRKVWLQYWDTCLTHERSYLARVNYVHQNPCKHRLVDRAEDYPWCSMAWFMSSAPEGLRRTVLSFKTDSVHVEDDF